MNTPSDYLPSANELIHESSPYLLQHAHNPVHWYPWGEKALQKAKAENKPLIISIGYAACHWCHVMEEESYADIEVARYMNEHFVAVKVDREERPDIDQIYMSASMLINGSGGWPLNAFALPDGQPFYAVTYLPKGQWLALLRQIVEIYTLQYDEIVGQAKTLTQGIASDALIKETGDSSGENLKFLYGQFFGKTESTIDFVEGGFNRSPKFPLPVAWEWMLQDYYISGNGKALKAVTNTLTRMAFGGIYDRLGGGFARYATDAFWRVPHFEKMLYDNAQLVSLYAHACQITEEPLYAAVIRQTLGFIKRELTDETGGFYSSLNADSEGEEGRFYVWTKRELEDILPSETIKLVEEYYHITREGNWEDGKNILFHRESNSEFAKRHGMKVVELEQILDETNRILFDVRSRRIAPSIDKKILTSWNALMLKGYVNAFQALGDEAYLKTALRNAAFLEKNMLKEDGSLWRNFMDGKAGIHGLLDDYVLLADGYIALYQVTFDKHWLDLSKALIEHVIVHFNDSEDSLFFYTPDYAKALIARKKEVEDNVIPSSNSVAANVLYSLGIYYEDERYIQRAKQMLNVVAMQISSAVPYFANWVLLMGKVQQGIYEVAVVGKEALAKNGELQRNYLPLSLFMGGTEANLPLLKDKQIRGQTVIYVCQNKTCKLPVTEIAQALAQQKRL